MAAPGVAAGIWLVNLLLALPSAWAMGAILHGSIDDSLVHETMRSGFDMEWYFGFSDKAPGIAASFTPAVVGAGAFFENLEAWITGELFGRFPGLVALGLLSALLWIFLSGGVLDRFACPEGPTSLPDFARAAGRYFPRFIRLALLSSPAYILIYLAARWFYGLLARLTRDVTEERTILALSLLTLGAAAALLVAVRLAGDYARIATVLEERRGMVRALALGFRFVLSRPLRVFGIYGGLGLVWAILLGIYTWVGPGAGPASIVGVLLAFLAGQLMLLARIAVRLALLGSETAFYRNTGIGPR